MKYTGYTKDDVEELSDWVDHNTAILYLNIKEIMEVAEINLKAGMNTSEIIYDTTDLISKEIDTFKKSS